MLLLSVTYAWRKLVSLPIKSIANINRQVPAQEIEQIFKNIPLEEPKLKTCQFPGCDVKLPKQARNFCTLHYKPKSKTFQSGTKHFRVQFSEMDNKFSFALFYGGELILVSRWDSKGREVALVSSESSLDR